MRAGLLAVLTLAGTILGGCEHLLKKNPNWTDRITASPDAWVFQPGARATGFGSSLEVRSGSLVYRDPSRDIVVEAVEPQASPAGRETFDLEGGRTYRIVRIECDADWALCGDFRTAQRITLTPTRIERTPLEGAPGYRSVVARQFDSVFISLAGEGMGEARHLERQMTERP